MKIIVAHPGKQHSYRTASALKKAGMLDSYITQVYDKDSSLLMKMVKLFLSRKNRKRAKTHYNPDLEDSEVVQFCEFGGLLEMLALRLGKSTGLYWKITPYIKNRFGIKVAKYAIKHDVDMVIGYDTNCTKCFDYLKKHAPQIKRVMDVSIAARPYVKNLYLNDSRLNKDENFKSENIHLWTLGTEMFQKEIELSDYFLVASDFVRDSIIGCGAKSEQILKVPYGANTSSQREIKDADEKAPLELLFVGQTNSRKGMPLLLECFSEMLAETYHLTVTGGYDANSSYISEHLHSANIDFTGFVTFDQMTAIYEKAQVFVIPSIAEGMAQVGIEAMACGLPVICTYNSGLSDLVKDGETGFIIPAGDKDALKEKIEWFSRHRDQIKVMGEKARLVAKKYTWEEYERNLIDTIKQIEF